MARAETVPAILNLCPHNPEHLLIMPRAEAEPVARPIVRGPGGHVTSVSRTPIWRSLDGRVMFSEPPGKRTRNADVLEEP